MYNVYRIDRSRYGGGVLIALRNLYFCTLLDTHSLNGIDHDGIYTFIEWDIYIPPSTTTTNVEFFFDTLFDFCSMFTSKILIAGDFNFPKYIDYHTANYLDTRLEILHTFLNITLFKQYNYIRNSYNRILDLVFANFDCYVTKSDTTILPNETFHPPLRIDFSFEFIDLHRLPDLNCKPRYDFLRPDITAINHALRNQD